MPFGTIKPICFKCNSNESVIWRKFIEEENAEEKIICNDCSIVLKKTKVYLVPFNCKLSQLSDQIEIKSNDETLIKNEDCNSTVANNKVTTRKSSRNIKKGSSKNINQTNKNVFNKGKGRRYIFKRNVYKSPASIHYPITKESIYYQGINYQIGDIVSVVDIEDGCTYFAQIRGFLQDQFCEKSAALSWLVPNKKINEFRPISEFNPANYVIGPEEDIPRKLECIEFVCRAPSDYYKASNSPYYTARPTIKQEAGFVWTNLGPIIFKKGRDECFL